MLQQIRDVILVLGIAVLVAVVAVVLELAVLLDRTPAAPGDAEGERGGAGKGRFEASPKIRPRRVEFAVRKGSYNESTLTGLRSRSSGRTRALGQRRHLYHPRT